ncbi:MAG TPA: 2'-5' RNA ligase family protein [Pedobacter sp.]|uniref:2'-5' RNA ligase family protein n=1 Tax=Pedobacter sp. TaxID=1411316 RepID=UPI002B80D5A0|nr:2'-5' RNA ligase family protein [Pedobacter sp.]HMI03797.1 2'-5' RNA ligase family protein [Pedobacter sp.]
MESLFFVAILPPPEISADIDEIRKQCSVDYQIYSALKPPVHITLIPPFKLSVALENKLVTSLQHCRNFRSFGQELHDYDGFPPKVIFIRANKSPGIIALHKTITTKIRPYLKESPGSINPHVTIAYRDVEEHVYEKIMQAYSKKHFRVNFDVNKFALLKHDGKKWNLFKEFKSRPQEEQYTMDL